MTGPERLPIGRSLDDHDPTGDSERLGPDDRATLAETTFRQLALLRQQAQIAGGGLIARGVCTNCGEPCLPLAVYCDAACRDDHEKRLRAGARGGR